MMPALCSALGFDPAGTRGIQKIWTEGLPETRSALPSFDCWSHPPVPEVVPVNSRRCKFGFEDEADDDVEELAFGQPIVPDAEVATAAPKYRNPLESDSEDAKNARARFVLPTVKQKQRRRSYRTPNCA